MAETSTNPVYEIYIDESSQTKHRYLLIGGLIIRSEHFELLEASLSTARLPELPQGELGWVKVSKAKLDAYRKYVDVFFENHEKFRPLEFHSIVIDTSKINDHKHNGGSRSVGFNKEIFQLSKKFGRIYQDRPLHIYPDFRHTDQKTEDLRLILNRDAAKRGDLRPWPYRRVHFRDSSKIQTMQLVDILLGAIGFHLNGHIDQPGASAPKTQLSSYILERAKVKSVKADTSHTGKFTIWHRKLE